jgi:hypothetical protein
MSEEKKQEPETDGPPAIDWETDSEGGVGIIGIDGGFAARRATAWERIIDGSASDEDRRIVAQLWTE